MFSRVDENPVGKLDFDFEFLWDSNRGAAACEFGADSGSSASGCPDARASERRQTAHPPAASATCRVRARAAAHRAPAHF